MNEAVVDYWRQHYVHPRMGVCVLCGNSGVIDTRGRAETAAGMPCGDRVYCICPNGQVMRRAQEPTPGPGEL